MSGIKSPYRNKIKTPAKTIGRIALDLIKKSARESRYFNTNQYIGSGVAPVQPYISGALIQGTETSIAVGSQADITLISPFTGDSMDAAVIVYYRSVNGDIMWPATQSRMPIANTVIYYYGNVGGDLIVTVINDSNINILATPWFCDKSGSYIPVAGLPGNTVEDEVFSEPGDAGASTDYSRKDHKHKMPADPVPVHAAITTGIHGVGASVIESTAGSATKVTTHSNLTTLVHGIVVGNVASDADARFKTTIEQSSGQRILMSDLSPGNAGFLLITNVAYWVYLGRLVIAATPKYVEFHVSVAGGGVQTAEVGFFSTPSAPNKANQTLTKLVSTGTVDALTGIGLKRNTNAFATAIPAGTHLWAGIRTAMAAAQPTIWGLGVDMNQGAILSTAAAGALTAAGPWAGVKMNSSVAMTCPDLRGVID